MKIDADNDYYAVLGVLPTAEDAAIRAVYRALAQRYHPDKNPGSDTAKVKMQALNEAYAVLSDPEARKEYDNLRSKGGGPDYDSFYENESSTTSDDPIWDDWEEAIKYQPELKEILNDLSRVSSKLAYSFQAYLVEEKAYSQAKETANTLQDDFLRLYFGGNQRIRDFALMLLREGEKKAARALNKAANLFESQIDADKVINRIRSDFKITKSVKPSDWGQPLEFSDATLKEFSKFKKR